jgi:hypothetical protein
MALFGLFRKKRRASSETDDVAMWKAKAALSVADVAGKVMKAQFETAARLNFSGRVRGADVGSPIYAFAYGLLLTALKLQGIDWTEKSLGPPDVAVQIAVQFVQTWQPDDAGHKGMVATLFHTGLEPGLEKYRMAGELAFQRFHDTIEDELGPEDYMRSTDDLARALGV